MNHTESLGAKQLFTPLRFRCQQVFLFRESFFRGPAGATRWREGDLCLIFKPASRFFLPSGKIPFPVARSGVASSLARTALCAFSTPPSSIFPQKIEKMFPDRQKGASASWITDFQSSRSEHTAPRKKSKAFHIIFYAIRKTGDKSLNFSKYCLQHLLTKKLSGEGADRRKTDQCFSRCHMMKKTEPTVMVQARSIFQVSISPPSNQPRKMPITGTTYS